MTETVFISLGSNLGDREAFLSAAVSALEELPGLELVAVSSVYQTIPIGMAKESPLFLNQVVKAEYLYSPLELLDGLERIEATLGRTDKGDLLPRTIDLDLLLFGEEKIDHERLQVPHPRMTKRAFVLVPMIQIDPEIAHPLTGQALTELVKPGDHDKVTIYRDYVAREI